MPSAPPRFLPSHAASVYCPHFTKNRFFVRLRSSGIVRAHRRPSPAIPAELPKGSPDSVRQTGIKARQNASFRVKVRPDAPEAKNSARLARTIPKFTQPGTTEHAGRQSRRGHQRPPGAPRHPWEEIFPVRHLGTFGDIWGHMSHSRVQRRPGTHCRARPANLRLPAAAPAPAAPGTHTACPARTPRRSPAAAAHRPTPPAATPTSRSPGPAQPVAEG